MADRLPELTVKYNAGTFFRYPENLDSPNSGREHVVLFTINQITPPKYDSDAKRFKAPVTATNPGEQINLLGFDFQISPPTTQIAAAIELYMPDTVTVSYDQSYQEDNLSDYTVAYYGQALGAEFGAKGKVMEALTSNPLNAISSDPKILALIRKFADNFVPVDTLLKGQGLAINPQVQLLFKATALRTFQFEFLFTPTSQKEADTVQQIIQKFKYHAAPTIGGGAIKSDLFFTMPDTFDIQFFYKGNVNNKIHRIDECVLESINVDYAPNGWAAFNDGSPVQTKMTLQFKELAIQDKAKIAQGF